MTLVRLAMAALPWTIATLSAANCPAGTAHRGSWRNGPCVACPAGRVSHTGRTCAACRGGMHQSAVGQRFCQRCPAGQYGRRAFLGNVACMGCPDGWVATGSVCSACSAGRFSHLFTTSLTCSTCPRGKYAAGASNAQCLPCSVGQYAPDLGAVLCRPCPAGKYSRAGGRLDCAFCSAGRFGREQGDATSACSGLCPRGKYSARGSHRCTQCLPGRYSIARGAALPCSQQCPAGRFLKLGGSGWCRYCPKGKYQQHTAQASCFVCAEGSGSARGARACTQRRSAAPGEPVRPQKRGGRCCFVRARGSSCVGTFKFVSSTTDTQVWRGLCNGRPMLLQRLGKFGMWAVGKTRTSFSLVAVSGATVPDAVPDRAWSQTHGSGVHKLALTCATSLERPTTPLPRTLAPTSPPTTKPPTTMKPTMKPHFEDVWAAWHTTAGPRPAPTVVPSPPVLVAPPARARASVHAAAAAAPAPVIAAVQVRGAAQPAAREVRPGPPPPPAQVDWTLWGSLFFACSFVLGAVRGGGGQGDGDVPQTSTHVWDVTPTAEEVAGITPFRHSYGASTEEEDGIQFTGPKKQPATTL
jgi:hypothetical protein